MNQVMIDLETLDTAPSAVVLAIGACRFDDNGTGKTFYAVLDAQPQLAAGRTVSASTINWWLQQSDDARLAIANAPKRHPRHALVAFSEWLKAEATEGVWGNGAGFDITILERLYASFDLLPPWDYTAPRCYRTLKALHRNTPVPMRTGVYHNALDDAVYQAYCASIYLRRITP